MIDTCEMKCKAKIIEKLKIMNAESIGKYIGAGIVESWNNSFAERRKNQDRNVDAPSF